MKHFLIFALTLIFAAIPVFAADLFNRPNKDALPQAPEEAPASPPQAAPSPVPETIPSLPQEEKIEDFAERYNQNCLKKKDPILTGEPLRMLCACSASKLQEKMTVDEVKAMMTDTPEGLQQRNRMAVLVYAPCMEYPTKALIMHSCKEHEAELKNITNADAICECMAGSMAIYTAANAPSVLAKNLAANPNDADPLGRFMDSPDFQSQAQSAYMSCLQTHKPELKK